MSVKKRVVTREDGERALETLARINHISKEEMRRRFDEIGVKVMEDMRKDDDEEERLLNSACKDRQDSLVLFASTGEASENLLNHIENCLSCSLVIGFMFNRQARSFEELAKKLRRERNKKL